MEKHYVYETVQTNWSVELEISSPRRLGDLGIFLDYVEEVCNDFGYCVSYKDLFNVTWGDLDGLSIDRATFKFTEAVAILGDVYEYVINDILQRLFDNKYGTRLRMISIDHYANVKTYSIKPLD